jgi:3-dehydroquinate synthase II/3-amino-4-hydroxybenzoic acid synthase
VSGQVWCDLAELRESDPSAHVRALGDLAVDVVVARPDQVEHVAGLAARVAVAGTIDAAEEGPEPGSLFVTSDVGDIAKLRERGWEVGLRIAIVDADSMNQAVAALSEVDALLVSLRDDTNIPLELVLAEGQGSSATILKSVATAEDALIAMGVLEEGVGGVVVTPTGLTQVGALHQELAALEEVQLDHRPFVVTSSEHAGMGWRSCIDTTDLFEQDEGMIIGSTSQGGLFVCAEVHYLPYMKLRPFRVNAGAVHSYAWAPNGRTEYLTDLGAGERVLAVSSTGRARPVLVGRIKTEIRPLRLIKGEIDGKPVNVFIQDDWHVRVMAYDGSIVPSTDVRPGDELMGHLDDPGRHVGIAVDEHIQEW